MDKNSFELSNKFQYEIPALQRFEYNNFPAVFGDGESTQPIDPDQETGGEETPYS